MLVLTSVATALLTACTSHDLAFVRDERVDIVRPRDRAEVSLPVRLEWRTSDLGRGNFFAAFVDRAPIAPGESLAVLADDTCERTPGCPDLAYLRERDVYVTDRRSLRLDTLPQTGSGTRTGARDRHEATIVVLDRDGRRVGESAYTVEFSVRGSR